jgi:anti-sigma-K factor RskA
MHPLSRNDEQLIFDCCLGLTGAEEAVLVRMLLAHNEQAADLHARLRAALGPLASLPSERCPAELAECTVRRLCAAARQARAAERGRTPRLHSYHLDRFWLGLSSNILIKSP